MVRFKTREMDGGRNTERTEVGWTNILLNNAFNHQPVPSFWPKQKLRILSIKTSAKIHSLSEFKRKVAIPIEAPNHLSNYG